MGSREGCGECIHKEVFAVKEGGEGKDWGIGESKLGSEVEEGVRMVVEEGEEVVEG